MSQIFVTTAATIVCHALALLGQWLLQRTRVQRDEAHRRLLVDMVCGLPRSGHIRYQRADGTYLTLAVDPELGARESNGG